MRNIEQLTDPKFQIRPIGIEVEQTRFTKEDDSRLFELSGRDYRTDVNIKNEPFTGKQIRKMLWLKSNYRAIAQGVPSITIDELMVELPQKFPEFYEK